MKTPALDAWTRRTQRLGAFGPYDALWRAACAEDAARRILAEGATAAFHTRSNADLWDDDLSCAITDDVARRLERDAQRCAREYLAKAQLILREAAAERKTA